LISIKGREKLPIIQVKHFTGFVANDIMVKA
jgi:hypothetical protein